MKITTLVYKAVFISTLTLLSVSYSVHCQTADSSIPKKIDQLFSGWNSESPGCVCAVSKGGKTIFEKGYGMANLELNVPLSPESVFYIASTSKQFTAASVALLALSGKISLDSSIREYIPEMPEYADSITVKNLLHHTSGIRDYFRILTLKGWNEKEYLNNGMAVDLISRQKGLVFAPGEQFAYSNSNYVLLAEIVKRTSGRTLSEYSRENIFTPLGMKNTHFDDDYETIVKNRVGSYGIGSNGQYFRFLKAFDAVGDGNLLTTVDDLFKWGENFKDHKLGGKKFTDLLLTRGKLNNGKELDYAFGLFHGTYRGLDIISHAGGFKGFRTEFMRFPDQDYQIAVLCNTVTANPTLLARQVSDFYLGDVITPEDSPRNRPALERKEIEVDPSILDDYVGEYSIRGTPLYITIENKQLKSRILGQPALDIFPESENKFFLKVVDAQLEFKRDEKGEVSGVVLYQNGQQIEAPKKKPTVSLPPERLNEFTGVFYSPELDIEYAVNLKEKDLVMKYGYTDNVVIKSSGEDLFTGGMFKVKFIRNQTNKITGFHLSAMDIENIGFAKTDEPVAKP